MTSATAATVRELPPECGNCSTPVAPRLVMGRAWLRCRCSARTAARHRLQLLPCVRCSLSAVVASPPIAPRLVTGWRLASMQLYSQSFSNIPGTAAAVRALQPGCSYCSTPIAPRLVTGQGLAAVAQNPPYPPRCADVLKGGGPILPPCAGMHMGGERSLRPVLSAQGWRPHPPPSADVHAPPPPRVAVRSPPRRGRWGLPPPPL